jgi:phosphatidate cytidylyltransferase
MLVKRLLSAAILIPVILAAVYFGGITIAIVALVAALLAGYEYLDMMRHIELHPPRLLGLALVAALVMDAQWPQWNALPIILTLAVIVSLVYAVTRGNAPGSMHAWALLVTGGLYIGFMAGHVIRLRALDNGMYWLALALVGTWICDTGAYFVGISMGRRPFFPLISPKKTVEGFWGGLVTGTASVVLIGYLTLGLTIWHGLIVGVLLCLAATFGDLAESVIKRQVGIKDSGRLIPGHGGALDRIDSLLFVVPVVYYTAIILMSLP